MAERDIVERLRELAANANGLSIACILLAAKDAADEIERLRSICGKAEVGRSFADLAKNISRSPVEPRAD